MAQRRQAVKAKLLICFAKLQGSERFAMRVSGVRVPPAAPFSEATPVLRHQRSHGLAGALRKECEPPGARRGKLAAEQESHP